MVAPLNWGLGHASRCIPIINELLKANYQPILASDGDALSLLQKEFPFLKSYTLPSYNIKYSKSSNHFKWLLLLRFPSIISAVKKERKIVETFIKNEQISGVISDNRFGVYNKNIPSVYITHQLNVLSGITTFLTSKVHQKIIGNFNEVWVPDVKSKLSLSGKLSDLKESKFKIKHIGLLSRFKLFKSEIKYDILVLLSGPEPQRTLLEDKLLLELKNYNGNVLFVRGVFSEGNNLKATKHIKVINYMLAKDLNKAICESNFVLARSGYSTIMDLAFLGKKAFFIPTPGQCEQEYLAELMDEKQIAPFSSQQDFSLDKLQNIKKYNGFKATNLSANYLKLFQLFEGE